ncbi:MAG TPA: hypothetical protein VFH51_12470 [Myxococcota bacterium]|nr:hypothetical protein [Myxococcota bacterium]
MKRANDYAVQLFAFIERLAVDHVVPEDRHDEVRGRAHALVDEAAAADRELLELHQLNEVRLQDRAKDVREMLRSTMEDTYDIAW